MDTVLQMGPHEGRVEGDKGPAGHPSSDGTQDTTGVLGCKCTWLMLSFSSTRTPKSFSAGLLSRSSSPGLHTYLGLPQPKCRTLHFALFNLISFTRAHLLNLSRSFPLDGIPSIFCVNCTTQIGVNSRLAEGALNPIISVTDKVVKEYWTQDRPLGDTNCYQPLLDIEVLTTAFWLHPSIQFLVHQIVHPSNAYVSNLEIRMW